MTPPAKQVPYARQIAQYAAEQAPKNLVPRVLRDLTKVYALIKGVTLWRFAYRQQDDTGCWLAEVADYQYVYDYISNLYEEAQTGTTGRLRHLVEMLGRLYAENRAKANITPDTTAAVEAPASLGAVFGKDLAKALDRSLTTITPTITEALLGGWLVDLNAPDRQRGSRRPYQLIPGEPLPDLGGLIHPGDLSYPSSGLNARTSPKSAATAGGSTFRPGEAPSDGTLNANPQETQGENGAFRRSTPSGGNGHRPVRTPVHLPEPT